MRKSIGSCSLCGGRVYVPEHWMGVNPPVPTCEQCGAQAKPFGPVIEMEPKKTDRSFMSLFMGGPPR